MNVDFMKDILNKIIGVYSKSKEEESIDLSVVFSPNDVNKMIDFFMYRLKKDFQVNPEILESEDINSGLKINFKGDNFYLDYSSNTLTEIICNFIEPKLSDIIKNN